MQKTNIEKEVKNTTVEQKDTRTQLEYLRDKHRQKVKGIFKFYEVPGGEVKFPFLEFAGDPVQNYTFRDGEVYEIPLGVAKHLNKNCWYPIHQYEKDASGKNSMRIGQKIRRMGFQSLEFLEDTEFSEPSRVLTAQQI